jgi:hypothetical protein
MKAQIAGIMMAVAAASVPVSTQATTTQNTHEVTLQENEVVTQDTIIPENETQPQIVCNSAQLTFIYPLGTGFVKSKEKCYHFSINILGGVTGYVKGFEAGGLFNINKYEVKGMQIAGIFNVGKSVTFQAGGIFNIAQESSAQIAGIFNIGKNTPFQAAGIYNVVKETKCQLAGIINIAQESRVQIGGIVNITKKGCFQMGLINVRDTADGVSLGLINIVKHGGVLEAGIEASEFVHTAATFRSGVSYLYSKIYVGYNYIENLWAVGYGLGTSFKLIEKLTLHLELTSTQFYHTGMALMDPSPDRPFSQWNTLIQFAPMLNYRILKHLKIYVGPTLNILLQDDAGILNPSISSMRCSPPYKMYHRTFSHSTLNMWIGVVGGLKF